MKFILKTSILFGLSCILFSCTNSSESIQQEDTRPNIIFIMADDMGYSDLGYYGSGIETPNLDKLAKEGVLFSQFYNTGRCCPTRATLMTGLYNHQTGMGDMVQGRNHPNYQGYLNESCITIAEILKEQDYLTMMSGKWHLGNDPAYWPQKRGFERFYGIPEGGGVYYYPFRKERNVVLDDEFLQPDSSYYTTTAFSKYAVQFVEEAKEDDRPFFLYLAHIAPHFPLQAPEEVTQKYIGKFMEGFDTLRKNRLSEIQKKGLLEKQWPLSPADSMVKEWEALSEEEKKDYDNKMAIYAAQMDIMDQGIGDLIQKLEDTGQLDNTIIFFLSDNGGTSEDTSNRYPQLKGEVGSRDSYLTYGASWANVSNTPFKYYKSYLYEGGISTPLIVHSPKRFGQARVEHKVAHVIDMVPTILELTQSEYPEQRLNVPLPPLPGKSLLPTLKETDQEQNEERTLFWEHEGDRAIRKGDWKLVSIYPENQWRLYNLAQDRTELNDQYEQKPELAQELEALYFKWADKTGVVAWEELIGKK
ncbi:MAG: arylsulfatase [Bacteroidota bacterium]